MSKISFILTLLGMHLIGSAVLFGYESGPEFIFAAPVLALFGIPMLLPEGVILGLMRHFYDGSPERQRIRKLIHWVLWCLAGGITASIFTPKEENNELTFWIAGFLGGICATLFALVCTHFRQNSEYRTTLATE